MEKMQCISKNETPAECGHSVFGNVSQVLTLSKVPANTL
jgi:hypothetical protein